MSILKNLLRKPYHLLRKPLYFLLKKSFPSISKIFIFTQWEYKFNFSLQQELSKNSELLNNLLKNTDQKSKETITLFYERLSNFPYFGKANLTTDELENKKQWDLILPQLQKKYHIDNTLLETDFFFYYGIKFLPNNIIENLKEGIFFDCGAFDGSTTIMMQNYSPKLVYAFEISRQSAKKFKKAMHDANVSNNKYELTLAGVGSKNENIYFNDSANAGTSLESKGTSQVQVLTLDSFVEKNTITNIKWIKADIEGFAFEMIKGAIELIKKEKPILTIGVYHNCEELLLIKPFIESLDLGYKFMFRRLLFSETYPTAEIVLIAWV